MSEADMHNNPPDRQPTEPVRAIPSPPPDAPAAWIDMSDSPFNLESEAEDWQTVNFPNAISIDEFEDNILEAEEKESTASGLNESEVAIAILPETPLPKSDMPQIAELVALSQQLRQRNNDLTHRVAQMENVLHECQTGLQIQTERSRSQATLLAQRTQELATAQAQAIRQTRELEASDRLAQHQQNLINSLTEQLETSQYRLAQMERECTLTQQRYSEQSHQLLQAENTAKDLRSRLHRQQRHTLQFKAALEKCLEIPDKNDNSHEDKTAVAKIADLNADFTPEPPVNIQEVPETPSFAPKAQPIKPWAAPLSTSPAKKADDRGFPELDSVPDAAPTVSQPLDSSPPDPDLSVEVYMATTTDPPDLHETAADANPVENPLWKELAQLIDTATEAINPRTPTEVKSHVPVSSAIPEPSKRSATSIDDAGNKDAIASVAVSANKPNWSVPVVYPQQPPKKRQSLAAIELPTFPRIK